MPKARPNSNTQSTQEPVPTTISESVIVGIDWADREHAFSARHPNGKIKAGSFKQNKAGIDEWVNEIGKFAPGCNINVCIETSSGVLINALMEYPQVRIFPVNPLALANYRKAFAPGGGKNDPLDARLIMQFLQHYRDQLRKLIPNSSETRELSSLVLDCNFLFVDLGRGIWVPVFHFTQANYEIRSGARKHSERDCIACVVGEQINCRVPRKTACADYVLKNILDLVARNESLGDSIVDFF